MEAKTDAAPPKNNTAITIAKASTKSRCATILFETCAAKLQRQTCYIGGWHKKCRKSEANKCLSYSLPDPGREEASNAECALHLLFRGRNET
jgi:hypothetical protein